MRNRRLLIRDVIHPTGMNWRKFMRPPKPSLTPMLILLSSFLSLMGLHGAEPETPPDAVQHISRAIRENAVVCLAEGGHGSVTAHDFLKNMLLDRSIQDAVDVIIVEFVTARYQSMLDDYMGGKDVPFEELSKLWRDTTVSSLVQTWDSPLYYEFLRHLRAVNRSMAPGKKIRVMGGDPPIRWEEVKTREDHLAYFRQRSSFPAGLAVEQAVSNNKKVLIIFGGAHLAKVPGNLRGRTNKGLANLVQERIPEGLKSYSFLIPGDLKAENNMEGLEKGKMYETRSHWSGGLPADRLFPMVFHPDGTKAEPYKGHQVKDLYDGLIYIGPLTDWLFASADVYQDDGYWTELNRRSMITRNRPMEEELRRR